MSIAMIVDIEPNETYKLFCSDKQIRYISISLPLNKPKIGDYVIYDIRDYVIYDIIIPNDYIRELCCETILPCFKVE